MSDALFKECGGLEIKESVWIGSVVELLDQDGKGQM